MCLQIFSEVINNLPHCRHLKAGEKRMGKNMKGKDGVGGKSYGKHRDSKSLQGERRSYFLALIMNFPVYTTPRLGIELASALGTK